MHATVTGGAYIAGQPVWHAADVSGMGQEAGIARWLRPQSCAQLSSSGGQMSASSLEDDANKCCTKSRTTSSGTQSSNACNRGGGGVERPLFEARLGAQMRHQVHRPRSEPTKGRGFH